MYYLSALSKTVSFIEENLCLKFTLDDLEKVNGFSRCHFSKLFHAFTGYSISAYIRGRRLSIATKRLKETDDRILDIALDLQFSSQDAFTRSFKHAYGMPPGQYRKEICDLSLIKPLDVDKLIWTQGGVEMKPEIKIIEKMTLIGMEYEGQNLNQEIGVLWQQFIPRMHEIKNVVPSQVSYGICEPLEENVEDVDLDNPNDFKYLAGVQVSSIEDIPEGMKVWHVDHEKYAVFTHIGAVELLGDTYKKIYSTWLPESGYEVEFTKDFEMYDERFKPGQDDSKMYVYIPVK